MSELLLELEHQMYGNSTCAVDQVLCMGEWYGTEHALCVLTTGRDTNLSTTRPIPTPVNRPTLASRPPRVSFTGLPSGFGCVPPVAH